MSLILIHIGVLFRSSDLEIKVQMRREGHGMGEKGGRKQQGMVGCIEGVIGEAAACIR